MSELITILNRWKNLKMDDVLDFNKCNQYAIVHHSTTIEGSTLTETETQLLLDEGITPKGKPLIHSLMNIDHLEALKFVIQSAKAQIEISPVLIQSINGKVMRQTGSIYNTALGIDASSGEFRKGNIRAGNSYFVGYDKVIGLLELLCTNLNKKIHTAMDAEEQLNLSFDAHFDLVTIHPFYDGNGRTSRLLMNFIQQYYGLPLGIVFKEDKAAYFDALIETRAAKDLKIFRTFMMDQYLKFLKNEMVQLGKAQKNPGKTGGFSLVF